MAKTGFIGSFGMGRTKSLLLSGLLGAVMALTACPAPTPGVPGKDGKDAKPGTGGTDTDGRGGATDPDQSAELMKVRCMDYNPRFTTDSEGHRNQGLWSLTVYPMNSNGTRSDKVLASTNSGGVQLNDATPEAVGTICMSGADWSLTRLIVATNTGTTYRRIDGALTLGQISGLRLPNSGAEEEVTEEEVTEEEADAEEELAQIAAGGPFYIDPVTENLYLLFRDMISTGMVRVSDLSFDSMDLAYRESADESGADTCLEDEVCTLEIITEAFNQIIDRLSSDLFYAIACIADIMDSGDFDEGAAFVAGLLSDENGDVTTAKFLATGLLEEFLGDAIVQTTNINGIFVAGGAQVADTLTLNQNPPGVLSSNTRGASATIDFDADMDVDLLTVLLDNGRDNDDPLYAMLPILGFYAFAENFSASVTSQLEAGSGWTFAFAGGADEVQLVWSDSDGEDVSNSNISDAQCVIFSEDASSGDADQPFYMLVCPGNRGGNDKDSITISVVAGTDADEADSITGGIRKSEGLDDTDEDEVNVDIDDLEEFAAFGCYLVQVNAGGQDDSYIQLLTTKDINQTSLAALAGFIGDTDDSKDGKDLTPQDVLEAYCASRFWELDNVIDVIPSDWSDNLIGHNYGRKSNVRGVGIAGFGTKFSCQVTGESGNAIEGYADDAGAFQINMADSNLVAGETTITCTEDDGDLASGYQWVMDVLETCELI